MSKESESESANIDNKITTPQQEKSLEEISKKLETNVAITNNSKEDTDEPNAGIK
jgi:hypothetical protein